MHAYQTGMLAARAYFRPSARLIRSSHRSAAHALHAIAPTASAACGPSASVSVAPGGAGSGYYSAEQIRELQSSAARQAAIVERARLDGRGVYSSDDAGPSP